MTEYAFYIYYFYGTYTSQQGSDGVPGYDVMLPKPIPLLRNEEITIIARIKGPNSHFVEQGKSPVKVDDRHCCNV